jgi:hypothetical protein
MNSPELMERGLCADGAAEDWAPLDMSEQLAKLRKERQLTHCETEFGRLSLEEFELFHSNIVLGQE